MLITLSQRWFCAARECKLEIQISLHLDRFLIHILRHDKQLSSLAKLERFFSYGAVMHCGIFSILRNFAAHFIKDIKQK